jgi:hypothetical protein
MDGFLAGSLLALPTAAAVAAFTPIGTGTTADEPVRTAHVSSIRPYAPHAPVRTLGTPRTSGRPASNVSSVPTEIGSVRRILETTTVQKVRYRELPGVAANRGRTCPAPAGSDYSHGMQVLPRLVTVYVC